MKTILLTNKKAGTIKVSGENYITSVTEKLKKAGFIITEIELNKNYNPENHSEKFKETELIVAAGGDGTISSAAAAAVKHKLKLGVIPLGTFNHFAKDLNIPLDPEKAVEVIINNKTILIDAAEVNGNIFINNSSLGLYPRVVKKRDAQIRRLGGNKFFSMVKAFVNFFGKLRAFNFIISIDGEKIAGTSSFIFIGNNIYKMDLFNLGARERIDEGYLEIYFSNTSNKFALFRFACLALINRLKQAEDFVIKKGKTIEIKSRRKIVDVSKDGEVVKLSTPLTYKMLEKNIEVIVP